MSYTQSNYKAYGFIINNVTLYRKKKKKKLIVYPLARKYTASWSISSMFSQLLFSESE